MRRAASGIVAQLGRRTYFNDGYNDARSLEAVFQTVLRKPHVQDWLTLRMAGVMDEETIEALEAVSTEGVEKHIALQTCLGDPHELLSMYSISENFVGTDRDGCPVFEVEMPDYHQMAEIKETIKDVNWDVTQFLSKELLQALGKEVSPTGAREYIEKLTMGADELIEQEINATHARHKAAADKVSAILKELGRKPVHDVDLKVMQEHQQITPEDEAILESLEDVPGAGFHRQQMIRLQCEMDGFTFDRWLYVKESKLAEQEYQAAAKYTHEQMDIREDMQPPVSMFLRKIWGDPKASHLHRDRWHQRRKLRAI